MEYFDLNLQQENLKHSDLKAHCVIQVTIPKTMLSLYG